MNPWDHIQWRIPPDEWERWRLLYRLLGPEDGNLRPEPTRGDLILLQDEGMLAQYLFLRKGRLGCDMLDGLHPMSTTRHTERVWDFALEFLLGLNSQGIRPFLLKGLSVGVRWYRDPSFRPLSDIDILLSCERDILTAESWLENRGFNRLSSPTESYRRTMSHESSWFDPSGANPMVEIHRNLRFGVWDRRAQATNLLLQKPETRSHRGATFLLLDTPREFVFLADHMLAGHPTHRRFAWMYDLVCIALSNEFMESEVLDLARASGLAPSAAGAVDLIRGLRSFGGNGFNSFVGPPPQETEVSRARHIQELQSIKGIMNKLRYLGWLLFPSSEYIRETEKGSPKKRGARLRYIGRRIHQIPDVVTRAFRSGRTQ